MEIKENCRTIKEISLYSVDHDGVSSRRTACFKVEGNKLACDIKTKHEQGSYDTKDWLFINHVSRRALEILGEW